MDECFTESLKYLPVFVLNRFGARHTEFSCRNIIEGNLPYLYILHRGCRVAELPAGVLPHNDMQRIYLFVIILLESNFPMKNHTLCPHPVAAGHLLILPYQLRIVQKVMQTCGFFSRMEMECPSCAEWR